MSDSDIEREADDVLQDVMDDADAPRADRRAHIATALRAAYERGRREERERMRRLLSTQDHDAGCSAYHALPCDCRLVSVFRD